MAYQRENGDCSGGSFKLMVQGLNNLRPNSPQSGLVAVYFEAKDTEMNLRTAFGDLQSEIDELQDATTEFQVNGKPLEKVVRIFLGGDYEFLVTVLGHKGACSTNFCIFCPWTLADKRDDPLTMDPEQMWDQRAYRIQWK